MRTLLRRRDFGLLTIGLAFSTFGDWCMLLVLGVWVKDLTGSDAAAGLSILFFAVASLLAPFAGWTADRFRRRPFLVVVLLGSVAGIVPLFMVHGRGDVWVINLVALALGLSGVLTNAGLAGLLKTMLSDDDLGEANAILRTTKEGLRLIGPLAGAALYAAFGATTVVAVDAATFVVAATALAFLRIEESRPHRPPAATRWFDEATVGFRHIRQDPRLRHTVTAVALALGFIGIVEPVCFAVVDAGLDRPPSFLGALSTVQGVGAIVGGALTARTMRRIGEERTVALGLVLLAIGFVAMAPPSLPIVALGFAVVGASLPLIIVGFQTLLQRRSPLDRIGRVAAAAEVSYSVPQVLAIATGAVLITVVSYRILLAVMAVGVLAAAGYLRAVSQPVARRHYPVATPA